MGAEKRSQQENFVDENIVVVRDLGVLMSDDATFKDQIEKVAKKWDRKLDGC